MAKTQDRKQLVIIAATLAVMIIGSISLANYVNQPNEPVMETTPSTQTTSDTSVKDTNDTQPVENTAKVTVDPGTLTSIAIEPLSINVFYTKGTPGFDFTVKKTADRTQYVDFTSTDLVGKKCTDDEGLFASIIKNPASDEAQTTTTQTVKVGDDTYGLSLAGAGCTDDLDLLNQYQTGFKEGFSSLTAL